MKIKEYIEKIGENKNVEDMRKLGDMLEGTLYQLKEYDEKTYDKYKMKLYEMAYGKVLTEEMAKEVVEDMKPYGEYWNIETTTSVKNQVGIKDISDIDFYTVMNMVYNDNKDTVDKFVEDEEKKIEMYVSLTKDFILDPDGKEGKVYDYFMKM